MLIGDMRNGKPWPEWAKHAEGCKWRGPVLNIAVAVAI